MNATQQAQHAYGANAHPVRTPRGTEYDALARVTSRLKSAAAGHPVEMRDLAAAIHDNRRLWTLLAADVAGPDNRLPEQTRARILSLAEFTRQHSGRVLAAQAGVAPLIEINTAVMRGLRDPRQPAEGCPA